MHACKCIVVLIGARCWQTRHGCVHSCLTAPLQKAGDFADVAYFILKSRVRKREGECCSVCVFVCVPHSLLPTLPPPHPILPPSLTVAQVNQYLDDLANGNTSKDRAGMKKALQLLLRNTSALEQKWLIRIILKVAARVGGEDNPEGTKDLVFNPFISGSTCACYSSIPTLCHLTLNLCLFVQSFVINTLCCLLFVLFVYCIDLHCVEPCA